MQLHVLKADLDGPPRNLAKGLNDALHFVHSQGAGAGEREGSGFNEGKSKPFTTEDSHRVTKGKILYASILGQDISVRLRLKSLAVGSSHFAGGVKPVELVGAPGKLKFEHTKDGLAVTLPPQKPPDIAYALRIMPA